MKKYLQIKEAILSDISAGRLKIGDQLPVREELITQYEVSRATLNKAIAELIQDGQLEAYRNRGTFVAKKTKKRKTALVANFQLDHFSIESQFYSRWQEALQHVIIAAAPGKMSLLDEESADRNLSALSEYDAVIWVMPSDKTLKKLHVLKHKSLIINRYCDNFNFVSTNHRQAQYDMTEHFIHRFGNDCYLTYLDIQNNSFVCSERREGFISACEENGRFYRFVRMNETFEENTNRLMKLELKPDRKNVIISPSHQMTGAVFRMAYLRGLSVGEDFFYSDFDNADSLMSSGIKIPSILQDCKRMGEEAVKAAEQIEKGPVRCFVPHILLNL